MIANATPTFRADIQALRGLAILLVLLHHAKLDFIAAGYLGVDIFFVISGYLITGIIRKDIEAGTFRFSSFYFRRAKRLLPAAYVTFFIATLLSAAFLTKLEMRDFLRQLIGAVTFSGNIALWLQTGYFEGTANLKPLLHVWSLAIEEQYYMLLPAAMVFLPRRFWAAGAVSLVVVSAALCFAFAAAKPSATFYLLPTRAWELALGSVGALIYAETRFRPALAVLFWPAIVGLIVIPIAPTGWMSPWGDATVVCASTLAVILRRHPALEHGSVLRPLIWLGNISYSLYLIHWPIFAFANNAYVSEVPRTVNISILGVALLSGYLLYRLVEQPVRRMDIEWSRKSVGATIAASCTLVAFSLGIVGATSPDTDYAHVRRGNRGLAAECIVDGQSHLPTECSTSAQPKILVWGDSYAMHLMPGILATTEFGLAQATVSNCAPFIGLSVIRQGQYAKPWAEKCHQANDAVLMYLAQAQSIETVVLASAFNQILGDTSPASSANVLITKGTETVETKANVSLALMSFRETVKRVRALGKRVVVVAPPPSSGFDIGRCLELKASRRIFLGADEPGCRISSVAYRRAKAPILEFLATLPQDAHVNVVSFDEFLCSKTTCQTELDGVFIYQDGGHLSVDGSKVLAKRMKLAERLLAAAK